MNDRESSFFQKKQIARDLFTLARLAPDSITGAIIDADSNKHNTAHDDADTALLNILIDKFGAVRGYKLIEVDEDLHALQIVKTDTNKGGLTLSFLTCTNAEDMRSLRKSVKRYPKESAAAFEAVDPTEEDKVAMEEAIRKLEVIFIEIASSE